MESQGFPTQVRGVIEIQITSHFQVISLQSKILCFVRIWGKQGEIDSDENGKIDFLVGDVKSKRAIRWVVGVIIRITYNVPSVHPRTCSRSCHTYHMHVVRIPPGMTYSQRTSSPSHMTQPSQSKLHIHCIRHVSDNICIFISFCILICHHY